MSYATNRPTLTAALGILAAIALCAPDADAQLSYRYDKCMIYYSFF